MLEAFEHAELHEENLLLKWRRKMVFERITEEKKKTSKKSMPVVQSKSQTIILNRLVIDCFLKLDPRCTELG